MKKVSIALAMLAGLALAPATQAADMAVKAKPIMAAAYNWSGFYFGAHGGWLGHSTSGDFPIGPGFFWDTGRSNSGIAGAHVGAQIQWNMIVLGIEGTYNANLSNDTYSTTAGGGAGTSCSIPVGFNCESRISSITTVGGKLGFAYTNFLFYGAGGYARATIDTRFTTGGVSGGLRTSANNGWYAGGGIDYMFMPSIIVGVDYRHYEFLSVLQTGIGIADTNVSAKADSVTARVTFKTP